MSTQNPNKQSLAYQAASPQVRDVLYEPSGNPDYGTERVMFLMLWVKHLESESSKIIVAGIGKPTSPAPMIFSEAGIDYFEAIHTKAKKVDPQLYPNFRELASRIKTLKADLVALTSSAEGQLSARVPEIEKQLQAAQVIFDSLTDKIASLGIAVSYGDPRGDELPRKQVADALTQTYGVQFKPQHIQPVVGDSGGLHAIFTLLNKRHPHGRIITTTPYYPLYQGPGGMNRLHFIDVMKSPGYRLTAESLSAGIAEAERLAEQDGGAISAFLFCDPNNPLGTVVGREEWEKIAKLLGQHPGIPIILDGAYEGLSFEPYVSLLHVAPDLVDRMFLLRTATKEASVAGDRLAIVAVVNDELRGELLQHTIEMYGHAPRCTQHIYGALMAQKTDDLATDFYRRQVEFVVERLKQMGAAMPDPQYQPVATFYVMADLSDLIGCPIAPGAERALGREKKIIQTSEDIAYSLLFKLKIMIAPLQYNGVDPKLGYLRITCADGIQTLKILMDRLENELCEARQMKQANLIARLNEVSSKLSDLRSNEPVVVNMQKELVTVLHGYQQGLLSPVDSSAAMAKQETHALLLQKENLELARLLHRAEQVCKIAEHGLEQTRETAARMIQKRYQKYVQKKRHQAEIQRQWKACVESHFAKGPEQTRYLAMSPKPEFLFWKRYRREQLKQAEMVLEAEAKKTPTLPA